MEKRRVAVGDRIAIHLPYSEVCMHLRLAGKTREVVLISDNAAQVYDLDNKTFSFPILPGEAGLYRDDLGWYTY